MAADYLAQAALRDAWSHLAASTAQGDELVGRRPRVDPPVEMLCGLNTAGDRYFLVPVGSAEESLVDNTTRGLRVDTQQLEIAGEGTQRYISVQCSEPGAYDLFDVVGAELLTAIASKPDKPRAAIWFVLSRWKRFWGDIPRSVMLDEDVAGLFGELWFLHVWLTASIGVSDAVKSWRGPFGARHDFESKICSVEVKTTTSRSTRSHRVSGIDQLSKPEGGPLFFFSLAIQREGGATNSIVILIDAIRSLLVDVPEIASLFDNCLAKIGYSDAFRDHYARMTYRVVNSFLFEVNSLFPRLTRDQLSAGDLMPGVSEVDYKIEVGLLAPLAVADRPDAAGDVLAQMRSQSP